MKLPPNVSTVGSSKGKFPLAFRWAAIGWGLITFIWFPIEDTTPIFLLILAVGWCACFAAWLTNISTTQIKPVFRLLIGALGGLIVYPTALILTLLKAGLHSHGFLDFTTSQLMWIARSTPFLTVIGLVASAAYHYFRIRPSN